jgi:hypothetical protein
MASHHSLPREFATMDLTEEQHRICLEYVLALVNATYPLQQASADPEVTLELLILAADLLKEHLQGELEQLRGEQAE